MATALHGMDLVLFFRLWENREDEDGARLRFQTEHTISEEKESESNPTKDGHVVNVTDGENSIEFTSYAYAEDKGTQAMWKQLHQWFKEGKKVETWEVDTANVTEEGVYEPTYYVGFVTAFEKSAPSDGNVELNFTLSTEGYGVEGEDTLTAAQLETLKATAREYESLNRSEALE